MDCSTVVSCNQSIIQLSKPKEVFHNIPKSRIKTLKTWAWKAFGCSSCGRMIGIVTWVKGVTLSFLVGFGMRRPSEIFDYYCSWSHIQIIIEKKDINEYFFLVLQPSGRYACAVACAWGIRGNSGLHIWIDAACPHDVVQPLISLINMQHYQTNI